MKAPKKNSKPKRKLCVFVFKCSVCALLAASFWSGEELKCKAACARYYQQSECKDICCNALQTHEETETENS